MAQDLIRYDLLAQDALRGVVRAVLADVAKNGLPGDHHFFIGFATTAPGVRISNRLRESYPEEMTVVMQHQFWDLEVTDTTFSISLSFNGVPERLVVPFSSIKGFLDPSVQFGLQFDPGTPVEANDAGEPIEGSADTANLIDATIDAAPAEKPASKSVKPKAAKARKAKADADAGSAADEASDSGASAPESGDKPAGAEVVSLDNFRKKS